MAGPEAVSRTVVWKRAKKKSTEAEAWGQREGVAAAAHGANRYSRLEYRRVSYSSGVRREYGVSEA